ncbi:MULTISPECIES: YnfA family protein [Rhodobacterales]|uniref:YnfA family protein n=1 Tax=Pelagivirga sediminicola TaxID=2170575 RepID=A0A2T7G2S5_9RHOB|nr:MULTISPECIES: YnfA family protein [Rhodobacterales]MCQ0090312.1 YnfA family protein [Roseovarius sp. M141]PVA08732.1 YnfA family protein [Pelagivirga sediminicola]
MNAVIVYPLAALAEIAGCFAIWAWRRTGASPLWILPGVLSLVAFAWLLAQVQTPAAGRSFAAYGGIYVAASILWMWLIEGQRPDRWDLIGTAATLVGAAIILGGARDT